MQKHTIINGIIIVIVITSIPMQLTFYINL